jgi:hypothetical protein
MERVKCGQCGLVNWQGATTCARCRGSLGTGVNPFENGTATKGGMNPLVLGFAAVMLAGISYGVYQAVAPATPVPQAQAENAAPAIDPQKMGQLMLEAQKQDAERLAKMKWQTAELPKFDKQLSKDLMQKSIRAPQVQTYPNVVPGGFGPPGAGVPYHTR